MCWYISNLVPKDIPQEHLKERMYREQEQEQDEEQEQEKEKERERVKEKEKVGD